MFFEQLECRRVMAAVLDDGQEGPFEHVDNIFPAQQYTTARLDYLTLPAAGDAQTIALNYLRQNAGTYGLTSKDLDNLTLTNRYHSAKGNVTHLYFNQTFNGLKVADAHINVNVTSDGRILSVGENFVTGLSHPASPVPLQPTVSAAQALGNIASELGIFIGLIDQHPIPNGQSQKQVFNLTDLSSNPIPVELQYVPKAGGGVGLAWHTTIKTPDLRYWGELSVDAETGEVRRAASYMAHASYNVFPRPLEDPADGPRSIVTNPQNATASPQGWHDTTIAAGGDFTDTRGNNINATLGGTAVAQSSAGLNFDYALDLTQAPTAGTNPQAGTTNFFYWVNVNHDILFHHGFDEVSGNFQVTNFSNQGLGGDAVDGRAQDPAAANNAFMATPPDGTPPQLSMGIVDIANPDRDFDLDSVTVTHEFGHGVSNRLTGGPANAGALNALQSGGMGEGWSDWLGILFTAKSNHDKNTLRFQSPWAIGNPPTGPGIRRFPSTFDMAQNPLTLGDFNGGFPNNEVHNAGEIWCAALWDMTWLLIERHGFNDNFFGTGGGQNLALDIVLLGMKLQPANPSFLEARDAILAADQQLTGGDNFVEIWTAFARRGFGLSADDGPNSDSPVVIEAFDKPEPPAQISGLVYNDRDGDGTRDAGENGLAGWTVFLDRNNNGNIDQGERTALTGVDGRYAMILTATGSSVIREIVQPDWRPTNPASGAHTINVQAGGRYTANFANQAIPGEIHGIKYNDLDGDGTRDPDEPGIQGVVIYVDLNNDGRINLLEPGAVTDRNGVYTIKNVLVGDNYVVREVAQPGMVQTFPDPALPATQGGAHVGVVVNANRITRNIDFGNRASRDWGDAPISYGTLQANNGANHGILPGFGLTLTPSDGLSVVDGEANGIPTANATGDDNNPLAGPDDENGVSMPAVGVTSGATITVTIGVRNGGFSPGVIQGWIDYNRDGDFDANEQILKDVSQTVPVKDYFITVPVLSTTNLGPTYARFRYGYERGIGPTGAAVAGEVEDYAVNLVNNTPVANPDRFGGASNPPIIKQNSDFPANNLNVLANDFGTTFGPPQFIPSDFPITTNAGGTVRIHPTNPTLLQYKPPTNVIGTNADFFNYRVTDGNTNSPTTRVDITITASDPVAVDDVFRVDPAVTGPVSTPLPVLENDVRPPGTLIKAGSITPVGTLPSGVSLTINGARDGVNFTRPVGFTGTVQFDYVIEDTDPLTNDSTGRITVQVTPSDIMPAASHQAKFSVQILDKDGNLLGPTPIIPESHGHFFVRIVSEDLRPTANPNPNSVRGVESAYFDVLVQNTDATGNAVFSPDNPVVVPARTGTTPPRFVFGTPGDPGFDNDPATGLDRYRLAQLTAADLSPAGMLNEIGGAHNQSDLTPPGPVGIGPKGVLTFRVNIVQPGFVKFLPDAAESGAAPVAVAGNENPGDPSPIVLNDAQVFLQPGPVVRILGGAEGEFSNLRNPLDANADGTVNALDVLVVVNDLNVGGPRPMTQNAIGASGILPSGFYVDTNVDGHLNVLDALVVLNHLNRTAGATAPPAAGGEGEGEGASAAALPGPSDSPADQYGAAVQLLMTDVGDRPASGGISGVDHLGHEWMTSGSINSELTNVTERVRKTSREIEGGVRRLRNATSSVETEAADALFASLSSVRENLRSRLGRRR